MEQPVLNKENIHLISVDLANFYKVVPSQAEDNSITFYIAQSNYSTEIKDELELILGKQVILIASADEFVLKLLSTYYRKEQIERSKRTLTIVSTDFLEKLLTEAKSLKSSDIHCEVYEKSARIRYRIDGQLIERYKIEIENYPELVNKIKIRSKLNITEKRLPQDGRITTENFDIRVSILPTLYGEKIVMRLLGQDASNIDLTSLGFQEEELSNYLEAVKKPNGIILISGPTGSGKTTTLYATLRLLNDSKRNIVTVEDPIEYTLKGINQVQLKEDIGLTFASALKSFLRQDPDVIMLGEIRDSETALMAIRASLTGHLVLSTIHTNSAIGTVSRLIDMGIPPYLISETLKLSVAQRLIRKLCNHCKEETVLNENDLPKSFSPPYKIEKIFKPVGCNQCFHTGYSGRTALYDVINIDFAISETIKNGTIQSYFDNNKNYKSLSEKAFDVLASGKTSLDEIYSILLNL